MADQPEVQYSPVELYKRAMHLALRARFHEDEKGEAAQDDVLDHQWRATDMAGRRAMADYSDTLRQYLNDDNSVHTLPPEYVMEGP